MYSSISSCFIYSFATYCRLNIYATDSEVMNKLKSSEAHQYFSSNKVGRVLLKVEQNLIYLKAEITRILETVGNS